MSSSPSPPPWQKLVPILVPTIGGPVAAFAFFGQFITSHPLLSAIAGLFYEMLVFILVFIAEVGQELRKRWVPRCADWLDNIIQGSPLRYRKNYSEYLCTMHRYCDVKGITTIGTYALELDQIFVELSINRTKPKEMSSNPISQKEPSISNSIWYYLKNKHLRNQHLVLIGPPGSGKTTILKHIVLDMVKPKNRHGKIRHTFPILLFLRDHVQSIKEQSKFSLGHALHDHLGRWGPPELPADWIKRPLAKGLCLIMLDGLDEIADPGTRRKVADWVEEQMKKFGKNRFIVTSRRFGHDSNPLSRTTVLEVCLFSHKQIDSFVHLWYLANERMSKQEGDSGVRMKVRAEAKAKDLLERLRNTEVLSKLAVNPLLLTMIVTVHCYSDELPSNRATLYAEICEVFLGKRRQAEGQTLELDPEQMQEVLESLAYYLMLDGKEDVKVGDAQRVIREPLESVKPGMQPEAFLRDVENVSGLLLEQENGSYRFVHLTFQEYLAATHIRKKQLGDKLTDRVKEGWWQETIRLYCAMCPMADAKPIIDAYLEDDLPSVDALTLVLDYVREVRDVHPDVKERVEAILKHGVEDDDPERRLVVAEALLARRQRQMARVKEGVYRDTSLVTCAEYQTFLDEQQAQGKYYQPDHWHSDVFPPGSGQAPILGVRRSDALAFCNWLTARDKEGWHYRLPRAEEWPLEERRKQKELRTEMGYWVENEPRFVWFQEEPSGISLQPLSDCIVRALSHARDHISTLDPVLVRNYAHAEACVLANYRADAHDRSRIIANAFDLACAHAFDLVHAIDRDRERDFARTRNGFLDLDRALDIGPSLDLYITLFLLQERIAGNLPVYEGILLVKDRQQEK